MSLQLKKVRKKKNIICNQEQEVSSTTDSMSFESLHDPNRLRDLKDLLAPEEKTSNLNQFSFKKKIPIYQSKYDNEFEYDGSVDCLPQGTHNLRFSNSNKRWLVRDYEQENQSISVMEDNKFLTKKKRTSQILGDRFIPSRKTSKFVQYSRTRNQDNIDLSSAQTAIDLLYKRQILQQTNFMDEDNDPYNQQQFSNRNTLRFSEPLYYMDQMHSLNKQSPLVSTKYFTVPEDIGFAYSKYMRKIPKVPFKVLDAPQLQDDFYLNLIDWGQQNILSVALGQCVYLWSAQTSKVTKLLDLGSQDQVTSVAWSMQGPTLSVGTNQGDVQIWDTVKLKRVRVMKGHSSRVGTLCFSQNLLSSGSRDKQILQRDIRAENQFHSKLSAHKQEVCGLKWSPDSQYLASGGNDNKLYLWSAQSNTPVCKFNQHQAAVKAIAWSPHQHCLLASGGGTADRTIRFWNALEGKHLMKEDTGSQVCNLMFSKRENEIISTHGYSQNQIVLWKCKGMKRIVTLTGHTLRVLYLAMSPDGQTIVTGAGDETLRFWNVYPSNLEENPHQEQKQSLSISEFSLR